MPLTPADVRNKQFSTTRLRPGYVEEEVDTFLDEVETELEKLISANGELETKLAECLRCAAPAGSVLTDPEPDTVTAVAMRPSMPADNSADTAVRVLALAQQTADQAIAEAGREAQETLSRAQQEAAQTLTGARQQSEQMISDAQARAAEMEQAAHDQHRLTLGTLAEQRQELERQVDSLRAFEREYRARLRAHVEGLLHDLEAGGADRDDASEPELAAPVTGPSPASP
jgi:DivIVA domain-containing protein